MVACCRLRAGQLPARRCLCTYRRSDPPIVPVYDQADLRTALSTSVLPSDQIAPGT
jgi:hypothetical protein